MILNSSNHTKKHGKMTTQKFNTLDVASYEAGAS